MNIGMIEIREEKKKKNQLLESLSCKSYIVYRSTDNKILGGKRYNKELEIASLTKMMTLYCCLSILE